MNSLFHFQQENNVFEYTNKFLRPFLQRGTIFVSSCFASLENKGKNDVVVVVVVLLFYAHGKYLRSCRDGQLT